MEVKKVLIIDLDAHQGNGHERDFLDNPNVFILDAYNKHIFPKDNLAKQGIDCKIELCRNTRDWAYLEEIESSITWCLNSFPADLIVYNAGTDILVDDPLGGLNISANTVIRRDEIVFKKARERNVPIVMLTSGGYTSESANVTAESITNLHKLGIISRNPEPK